MMDKEKESVTEKDKEDMNIPNSDESDATDKETSSVPIAKNPHVLLVLQEG